MIYRFDDFTIDTATRRLLKGSRSSTCPPRRSISSTTWSRIAPARLRRRSCMQQVWPATHVLETNLASLVAEIRQTLGDSAEEPRYLRNVHRFGYWFVGAVDDPDDASLRACAASLLADARLATGRARRRVRRYSAGHPMRQSGLMRRASPVTTRASGLRARRRRSRTLGSKNGTFLAGRRVSQPSPLGDGDEIRLGSVVATFRIPPPARTTTTLRSGR